MQRVNSRGFVLWFTLSYRPVQYYLLFFAIHIATVKQRECFWKEKKTETAFPWVSRNKWSGSGMGRQCRLPKGVECGKEWGKGKTREVSRPASTWPLEKNTHFPPIPVELLVSTSRMRKGDPGGTTLSTNLKEDMSKALLNLCVFIWYPRL